jgi:toxin ParE1/3/4
MSCSYRIAPTALRDISEVLAYLDERNPDAAKSLYHAFVQKIELLARYPYSGKSYKSATCPSELRYGVVDAYQLFYRVSGDYIEIVRVLHGARDLASILH